MRLKDPIAARHATLDRKGVPEAPSPFREDDELRLMWREGWDMGQINPAFGDLGYHIMYEMARQDPLPIVKAKIVTWEKK